MEDALFLARGSEKVYVIHRRDSFRAAPILQKKLRECENVEILWNTTVSELVGNSHLECLKLKRTDTGEESMLDVEGVFIAVGTTPNTRIVEA